ncbi:MAG: NAD-dependent epimerase/dehydratase family protein [Bacteroidales bacterium]|nr:NAD-dependent epimerase/dehydratase family protein [Bacteroidales bacterium]
MKSIDPKSPILVTGASGYLAGWICKKLLEQGYTVHAAIRNPEDVSKTQTLNKIAQNSSGQIRWFKSDLLVESSYLETMEGCELVFHTASPFINKVKNPQRDLIDPAVKGTSNVLRSANASASVKRVVLTSSVAAVMGDTKDLKTIDGGVADETHWNFSSNIRHQAYSFSKTLAEKKAWEMVEQQSKWDLVVINPTLILGPGIQASASSESFKIMKQIGDGTAKWGAPGLDLALVDVRDVADAHIKAGFNPSAKGRHIISADHKTILEISRILYQRYHNQYHLPKTELPKWVAWLVGPLFGLKRKMVSRNFGYPWLVNNQKSIDVLNLKYRPIETTIKEHFQQMIEEKMI